MVNVANQGDGWLILVEAAFARRCFTEPVLKIEGFNMTGPGQDDKSNKEVLAR